MKTWMMATMMVSLLSACGGGELTNGGDIVGSAELAGMALRNHDAAATALLVELSEKYYLDARDLERIDELTRGVE